MKKMINFPLAVYLLLSGYGLKAQTTQSAQLLSVNAIGTDPAAVRATRDFWQKMGDEKDERWYKLPKGYLAYYKDLGVEGRMIYNWRGGWVYSVLTYDQEHVPETINSALRDAYSSYSITWVKEVTEGDTTVYVAHLENKRSWKEITIQDGEMRETKAYSIK